MREYDFTKFVHRRLIERKYFSIIQVKFPNQKDEEFDTLVVIIKKRGWNNYKHIFQALNSLDEKWSTGWYEEVIVDNLVFKSNRHTRLTYIDMPDEKYKVDFLTDTGCEYYYKKHNPKIRLAVQNGVEDVGHDEWAEDYRDALIESVNSYITEIIVG